LIPEEAQNCEKDLERRLYKENVKLLPKMKEK
jgi:hypothetical protein